MSIYTDGMAGLLHIYAKWYVKLKSEGKSFVTVFYNCPSIRNNCKSINCIYRRELPELRKPECVEYAKKFDTDRDTLADTLSLIFYVLK
jgi:hypothetical protein